jgi:hypothetical protein
MKGVVFTELIEFTENEYGFDVVDKILIDENGDDKIFTQAGNYSFEELVALFIALSKETGDSIENLLYSFGVYLFGRLAKMASFLMDSSSSSIEAISKVDTYIHIEVKKLYPDADLPEFKVVEQSEDLLKIEYISDKKLEPFAKGLMVGCGKHFGEELNIETETISTEPHTTLFRVQRV